MWLKKMEGLFGPKNSEQYVGSTSDLVYRFFLERLEGFLNIDRAILSKEPYWVEEGCK